MGNFLACYWEFFLKFGWKFFEFECRNMQEMLQVERGNLSTVTGFIFLLALVVTESNDFAGNF